jgi:hypothetical protein
MTIIESKMSPSMSLVAPEIAIGDGAWAVARRRSIIASD